MLKVSRFILALCVITLSVYVLITKSFDAMPYMLLLLGVLLLELGISELKNSHKWIGIFEIAVSLFLFFVAIQGFVLN